MTVEEAPPQNHYSVLGLDKHQGGRPLSAQQVKAAYKKALLIHHPDKTKTARSGTTTPAQYSVDSIALAYKILSDPNLRQEYDFALRQIHDNGQHLQEIFHTGLDTVDLDDLAFNQNDNTWTRACRCGNQIGFLVTEPELVKNVDDGELIIGCRGCSLWLRVLFSVEE